MEHEHGPTPKICPLLSIAASAYPGNNGSALHPCIQGGCEWWLENSGCELTYFSPIYEALDSLRNKI